MTATLYTRADEPGALEAQLAAREADIKTISRKVLPGLEAVYADGHPFPENLRLQTYADELSTEMLAALATVLK